LFEAPELLASYAAGIRQISGAVSTSLFVRPALSTEGTGILVADGGEAPPEHASVETAMQAATAHADSRGWFVNGGLSYVRSSDPHSVLIPLHPRERATSGPAGEHRRKGDAYDASLGDEPIGWLGLRLTPGPADVGERLMAKDLTAALADQPRRALWWRWLFEIGSYLAIHASQESVLLRDPVTGALSRVVFQGALVSYLRRATIGSRPLTLLFLNPDEFGAVNQRLGRETADEALREMVNRLRSSIRSTDVLARYGGAIYTILLPNTSAEDARVVVQKIVRAISEAPFGDGSLRLRLSVGVAGYEPGDLPPDAMELIRRADRALNAAKRQGGGRTVEWGERVEFEGSGHFDRLTGIFTGNLVRDYRNMVLLWDAVNVMAASDDADTLGRQVAEKLFQAFRPLSVAFIATTDEGKPRLAAGLLRSLEDPERSVPARHEEFGAHRWGFIARVFGDADTSAEWIEPPKAGDRTFAQFVPMAARGHKLGGLFIDVDEPPDTFDRLFLESLASQLAVALDRARLAHGERRRNEDEGRLLRAELSGLRQALQRAKLECRSPQGPEVAFEALGLPEEPEGGAAVGEPAEPEAAPRPPGRTALRGALGEAVATLGDRSPTPPLGKWLSSDLVILADDRGSRISRRSANLLGIPETTFRRLLKKARDEEARGFAERPDAWTPVQASLGPFLDATGAEARCDRLVAAESLLLQAISDQFPGLDAMGAALLGVTLPTYRKRSAAALR
jgi:diguanylate cyclase (GGDEF)-like protein